VQEAGAPLDCREGQVAIVQGSELAAVGDPVRFNIHDGVELRVKLEEPYLE